MHNANTKYVTKEIIDEYGTGELFHTFFGLNRGCADVISGEVNIVVPL